MLSRRRRLSALRDLRPLRYEGDSSRGYGAWTNGSSRVELVDNGHRGALVLVEGSAVVRASRTLYNGAQLRKGVIIRQRGEALVMTGSGSLWRNRRVAVSWRDRNWLVEHTTGNGVVLKRDLVAVAAVARSRPLANDVATVEDLAVLFVVGYANIAVNLSFTAALVYRSVLWYPRHRFPRTT